MPRKKLQTGCRDPVVCEQGRAVPQPDGDVQVGSFVTSHTLPSPAVRGSCTPSTPLLHGTHARRFFTLPFCEPKDGPKDKLEDLGEVGAM